MRCGEGEKEKETLKPKMVKNIPRYIRRRKVRTEENSAKKGKANEKIDL